MMKSDESTDWALKKSKSAEVGASVPATSVNANSTYSRAHVSVQPSPSMALPSSHCSPAAEFQTPSPHTGTVQSESQLAELPAVSQDSPAVGFSLPSPHVALVQSSLHIADSAPSSHASPGLV